MPEPHLVHLPETVYRIGKVSNPMRFSTITPHDASMPRAGNRYDVPGGEVLYAATEVRACFGETLARFRPTPKILAYLEEQSPDDQEGWFMVAGGIPTDWRLQRRIVGLSPEDPPLPFLDVEHPDTQAFLSQELASTLVALGHDDENVDLGDVHTRDRRFSRAIASWAYTAVDEDGDFRFSGIRYASRINTAWECWAIFDGTPVYETSRRGIELNDPDLTAVCTMWNLRAF